ncbi:Ig-like domain-containing protein [Massilia soli]|uniref:Ig-like domain-containing protein n=1 Tax=Massilia soli TaxID=2792854 RepID=A0ABS7SRI9_9BURK|nr:Ig-like domain-containing protein [Massilia soli]MBZ2208559.1 Ig-like domain-containing protein [Massilia soli]
MRTITTRAANWTVIAIAAMLGACGGGGGGDGGGCLNLDPSRNPALPACSGAAPGAPAAALAPIAVSLAAPGGAATSTVSPKTPATAQAVVRTGSGNPVAGVAVTFTSSDTSAALVPASGTALTDSSGVASIGVAAGTQAGAYTITASATKDNASAKGSVSYTVVFPVLTMSALTIGPSPLAAGGTASLSVTVMDGATPFAPAQSVAFTSPCAAAGKAVISSPVSTVNGVASTSYIDKGCGAPDVVTATTTLAGAATSQSGTVSVQSAVAGQLAFVSALPQNISLKGTGGAGRQESSVIVFKLRDKNGNPVSGKQIDFSLTTTVGGLAINPATSTTGADGSASTVVAGGTVNTPVRVIATVAGTTITSMSDQLVVSTGVPDQNSFTIATEIYNVEGANYSGCPSPVGSRVTVRLADHFNNPAPDGTAVSFTAEGGTVDGSCLTGLESTTLTDGTVVLQKGIPGSCSVRFCAANPRPADGRVTILAYALGEESFVDTKGTNLYYDAIDPYQDLGEPFRNDRAITNLNANANWGVEDATPTVQLKPRDPDGDRWSLGNRARIAGETFIDSNSSGGWNSGGDGIYNGVLKPIPDTRMQVTHVRGAIVQVMSASSAAITSTGAQSVALSHCVSGTPFVNNAVTLRLAIRDTNPTVFALNNLPGNILPAGTRIEFSASNGTILGDRVHIVPNTNSPAEQEWTYTVMMQSDATQTSPVSAPPLYCSNTVTSGELTVKVTTPMGVVTTRSYPVTD